MMFNLMPVNIINIQSYNMKFINIDNFLFFSQDKSQKFVYDGIQTTDNWMVGKSLIKWALND